MAYGDGSIFKNERGTWTGFRTIDGRRYKRTGKDKTAVRAAFKDLERQLATGERSRSESLVSVSAVVAEWLARDLAARDRAPSTVNRYRWAAAIIDGHLGAKRAARLRIADVEKMLDDLAGAGMSRASLVAVKGTLSQALRFAVRRDLVSRNVAGEAVIPNAASRTKKRRSLSPADARALLAALHDERNGLAFALSLTLGLRPGEAWGLHWVDLHDGALNITRAVRRDGGRVFVAPELKTEGSRRTIALPSHLLDWLETHRLTQVAERLKARTWDDDRLMFASGGGLPMSPSNARRQLRAVCKRAEVPEISPNELRHSCASLLSDQGIPNEQIADLLGHTTTRMVDQTYRHRLRPVVDVATRADWTKTS